MKKFEQLKKLYRTINGYKNPFDFSNSMTAGITSDFDRLFELAWKTMKEYLSTYLEIREAKTGSPKIIISLAYKEGIINNEKLWLSMLANRNDDFHCYRSASALLYASKIQEEYLSEIEKLIEFFKPLIPEEPLEDVTIPESLLATAASNNEPLVHFVDRVKAENSINTNEELFVTWDKYKEKYQTPTPDSMNTFNR